MIPLCVPTIDIDGLLESACSAAITSVHAVSHACTASVKSSVAYLCAAASVFARTRSASIWAAVTPRPAGAPARSECAIARPPQELVLVQCWPLLSQWNVMVHCGCSGSGTLVSPLTPAPRTKLDFCLG